MAGINLRTLQRAEAGNAVPRGETLRLLAQVLEVPVETFSNTRDADAPQLPNDSGMLHLLNFSSLSFWLFPFGNVLLPLGLWLYKRDTVAGVDAFGKRVLCFQIIWTVVVYGSALIGMFSSFFWDIGIGMFPIYGTSAMLVINTIVIALTHFTINRPGWRMVVRRWKPMQ